MVIDTSKLNATSWKTTILGIISGAAVLIASNPDQFVKWPWLVTAAKIVAAGGLASLGLAAKDSNVTGGTTLASGSVPDAALHAAAANEVPIPKVP